MAKPKSFMKLSEKKEDAIERKPGGSNVKNHTASDGPFAGTEPNTFPIRTMENARSALKLAHNDPNPGKVRARVFARFPELRQNNKQD